jgi:hypothetical protein
MEEIFKNDNLKIIIERKNQVKIEFTRTSYPIIHSLLKSRIIPGASSDTEFKLLTFSANTVKTLNQYLKESRFDEHFSQIQIVSNLIKLLSKQLHYLMEYTSHTILGYNPSHIIIINDSIPVYIDTEFVIEMESTSFTTISYPFSTNDFFVSPELLNIWEIPSQVNYKTTYFSLACLAIYILLDCSAEFYNEYIKQYQNQQKYSPNSILQYLDNHPIKETKIYWLLSRCLVEQPESRVILFI